MTNTMRRAAGFVVLVLSLTVMGIGNEAVKVEKRFDAAEQVIVKTVSGDLELKPGSEGQIQVLLSHNFPDGQLEPLMEMQGNVLMVTEKMTRRNTSGQAKWTISIPPGTSVKYISASGDCRAEGLRVNLNIHNASGNIDLSRLEGDVDIKTASGDLDGAAIKGAVSYSGASGDIKLTEMVGPLQIKGASSDFWGSNLSGDIQVSLASGEIVIRDSNGTFAVKTASGDVSARDVILSGGSEFKSASGSVLLRLGGALTGSVSLKSASGQVTLQQYALTQDIEFICTVGKDKGQILAPFDFETERIFEQYGQAYSEKTVKFGKGGNRVIMSSSSGDLNIEK